MSTLGCDAVKGVGLSGRAVSARDLWPTAAPASALRMSAMTAGGLSHAQRSSSIVTATFASQTSAPALRTRKPCSFKIKRPWYGNVASPRDGVDVERAIVVERAFVTQGARHATGCCR